MFRFLAASVFAGTVSSKPSSTTFSFGSSISSSIFTSSFTIGLSIVDIAFGVTELFKPKCSFALAIVILTPLLYATTNASGIPLLLILSLALFASSKVVNTPDVYRINPLAVLSLFNGDTFLS